jgi:hypothetical protein
MPFAVDRVLTEAQRFAERIYTIFRWAVSDDFLRRYGGTCATTFESTSAAGTMLMRPVREPLLVGFMLAGLGSSSAQALPPEMAQRLSRHVEQTTAGTSIVTDDRAGLAIAELRRLSGFTWDQLARLFAVSRRSHSFLGELDKAMIPSN